MIEAFTARSGAPSLRIDGVAMHSPYDPAREALRFAEETLGGDPPSSVIILGEGLGHNASAVARLFPRARILRVIYSAEVARLGMSVPGPAWDPAGPLSIADFLRRHLGELDVEGLRVMEWPPSARMFPEVSAEANDAVRQVVQELNGSFVTAVGAGRRWVRNSVANFLCIEAPLAGAPCTEDRPVVICAPGPSLEDALGAISRVRSRVDVWALPSSVPFLSDARLSPDLLVMTDPGYYAVHHMHFDPLSCPIALPLSAARGSWCLPGVREGRQGHFLLAQPVAFEQALLDAAGLSAPLISPHGTVAATALDLALSCTRAPVIMAGLDMCFRDILSHARPNAFDRLLHAQSCRFSPQYSLGYSRAMAQNARKMPDAGGAWTSSALQTYAGWFDQRRSDASGRLYRLLPSAVSLKGMRDLSLEGLRSLVDGVRSSPRGPVLRPLAAYPSRAERQDIVRRLIQAWVAALDGARPLLETSIVESPSPSAALSLAYVISPRLLMDARRKTRIGDYDGARTAGREMVNECIGFLRLLSERIGDRA